MKTVQNKDGHIIDVADDTPCHAGINGALPIMLDVVKDVKIFDEMAEKAAAWEAEKPEREIREKDEKLINEYLSAWAVHKQLEAFQDKLNGDSTKFDKMNLDFKAIKAGK